MRNQQKAFVAVHAGAGFHHPKFHAQLTTLCNQACRKAMHLLKFGESSKNAVAVAIKMLEDSPLTNAGYGSSLTIDGQVECDASLMTDENNFGSVGALSGVANPILVAKSLIDQQERGSFSHGRVTPRVLVSSGAQRWALRNNIPICQPSSLVTDVARKQMKKVQYIVDTDRMTANYCTTAPARKRKYSEDSVSILNISARIAKSRSLSECCSENSQQDFHVNHNEHQSMSQHINISKYRHESDNQAILVETFDAGLHECPCDKSEEDDTLSKLRPMDTIGAIAMDHNGVTAAGSSSGGIWLKQPGRLGHAAMYGCGCWAGGDDEAKVCATCSGCGEFLMSTLFSYTFANDVQKTDVTPEAIQSIIRDRYIDSRGLKASVDRVIGVIGFKVTRTNNTATGAFISAYSSPAFIYGWMFEGQKSEAVVATMMEKEAIGRQVKCDCVVSKWTIT